MYLIIIVLALPVLIKLFTTWGLLKLRLLPKSVISAEMVVDQMNRNKIRPLRLEQKYATVKYNFNKALKNKQIDRCRVLAIKEYLKQHTQKWEYKNKTFENDAHMIYHLLKSKSLKARDFDLINLMIK